MLFAATNVLFFLFSFFFLSFFSFSDRTIVVFAVFVPFAYESASKRRCQDFRECSIRDETEQTLTSSSYENLTNDPDHFYTSASNSGWRSLEYTSCILGRPSLMFLTLPDRICLEHGKNILHQSSSKRQCNLTATCSTSLNEKKQVTVPCVPHAPVLT